MASRTDLHKILVEKLGSKNVYYDPPMSLAMSYPAIRYTKESINSTYANDNKYLNKTRYNIIVISKLPDNPVIEELMKLPYCSYDRHYVADNLHHDTLTLYF